MVVCLLVATSVMAQNADTLKHIEKLEIAKKKTKSFSGGRDSTLSLTIDTLIMNDRAQLQFFGLKKVTLSVGYAQIGDRVYISGTDGKNNGSHLKIDINFIKLGSLYVLVGGYDANNGTKTFPNGNGGNVQLIYAANGIKPQTVDKKAKNYLLIDTRAGGYRVNPQSDLRNIYSQMRMGSVGRPLGALPQGQIYSGSPGIDGKSSIVSK
ncbi:hypothetical protein SAMN05216436_11027 [bacterium A37T11]|nr:hypothetical protein SAMN05216436_11027 [bacterium A37T11]